MNVEQLTNQVIYSLAPRNFTWGVGLNEAVLSRVVAGPAPSDFFQHDLVTPAALLHVDAGADHEEHPADLVEKQSWTLELYAANATEQSGSAAVVGGNRVDLGSSRGRGLLEIEPLVKAQLLDLLGLTARPRSVGGASVAVAGKAGGLIAVRALEITATRFPSLPDYAPVRQLKGTSPSGGHVALTFAQAPDRYDLVGFVWARGASGGAYPTDPTLATFVALRGATSLADAPGAGTWPYSLWFAYDSTVDPYTGTGVVPVAPNAWSSYRTAQDGLVYVPAQVTVVA